MKIFITGIAGMIGFHLSRHLASQGHTVWGIDNFNSAYYDSGLKADRCALLLEQHIEVCMEDVATARYDLHLGERCPDMVIHLAAHANPRHSLQNPMDYMENNIGCSQRLIDACEQHNVTRVIYASSSCVMHGQPLPWNETDRPLQQNNPYGWSKWVNECQFTHSRIPQTSGLRFFTVYGPWGRPDMALHLFVDGILEGRPITVYNQGDMKRDFTYVDDIVQGIELVAQHMMQQTVNNHEIYCIGNGTSVNLMEFVREIEHALQLSARIDFQPAHPADVLQTWSDTSKIAKLGYRSTTSVREGIARFVEWHKSYYRFRIRAS